MTLLDAARGGGINNGMASITLNDFSSISDNMATSDGGGIWNIISSVTLNGSSSITFNSAVGDGGGIRSNGTVTLTGSGSITDNTAGTIAGTGGGIFNESPQNV